MSSQSWEKSCYEAIVQLRALLEENRFTFANVISIMKQLDLDKQRKQQSPKAQTSTRFANATQSNTKQRCKRDDNPDAAPKNDSTKLESNDKVSLTELPKQTAKNAPQEMPEDVPMEIVAAVASPTNPAVQETNSHDAVIKLLSNTNAIGTETSIISSRHFLQLSMTNFTSLASFDSNITELRSFAEQSLCNESVIDDPLFYVRATFGTASQNTIILPGTDSAKQTQSEAILDQEQNSVNLITGSTSISLTSSQSHEYHDYCLSQKDFDISLPSQSTPSDVARITARCKEAEIFRQIEGSSFDEKAFFDSIREPLRMDLTPPDDEDVVMLPE